jgi:hypothetical protein
MPVSAQASIHAIDGALRVYPPAVAVPQTPAVQVCPERHARPHDPQFVTLVERSASQPLDVSPSQLA